MPPAQVEMTECKYRVVVHRAQHASVLKQNTAHKTVVNGKG